MKLTNLPRALESMWQKEMLTSKSNSKDWYLNHCAKEDMLTDVSDYASHLLYLWKSPGAKYFPQDF